MKRTILLIMSMILVWLSILGIKAKDGIKFIDSSTIIPQIENIQNMTVIRHSIFHNSEGEEKTSELKIIINKEDFKPLLEWCNSFKVLENKTPLNLENKSYIEIKVNNNTYCKYVFGNYKFNYLLLNNKSYKIYNPSNPPIFSNSK